MSDANTAGNTIGIINRRDDPALEHGEHAGLETNTTITPQEEWLSLLVILCTAITALLAYFFGPDFNKEQPLFGLAVAILQDIYWSLYFLWLAQVVLHALFGPWSKLRQSRKTDHGLASIVAISALLIFDAVTVQKVPLSLYPFVITVLMMVTYLSIEVIKRVSHRLKKALKSLWDRYAPRLFISIGIGITFGQP